MRSLGRDRVASLSPTKRWVRFKLPMRGTRRFFPLGEFQLEDEVVRSPSYLLVEGPWRDEELSSSFPVRRLLSCPSHVPHLFLPHVYFYPFRIPSCLSRRLRLSLLRVLRPFYPLSFPPPSSLRPFFLFSHSFHSVLCSIIRSPPSPLTLLSSTSYFFPHPTLLSSLCL